MEQLYMPWKAHKRVETGLASQCALATAVASAKAFFSFFLYSSRDGIEVVVGEQKSDGFQRKPHCPRDAQVEQHGPERECLLGGWSLRSIGF
jgi:hypothetical protein